MSRDNADETRQWNQVAEYDAERKAVNDTKRRIEITVERHRLIVIKDHNVEVNFWCEMCAEQVRMVTPDQAARLSSVSSRTIYRWIETNRVHFTDTPGGFSLICLQSLEGKGVGHDSQPVKNEGANAPKRFSQRRLVQRILRRR